MAEKYIKVGFTHFLTTAVKGKTLKELKAQHPNLSEKVLKALIEELKPKKKK